MHIARHCGPFATYRRVSCLSASTICICITGCGSGDRRAGRTRTTLWGGFHGRVLAFYRSGGIVRALTDFWSSLLAFRDEHRRRRRELACRCLRTGKRRHVEERAAEPDRPSTLSSLSTEKIGYIVIAIEDAPSICCRAPNRCLPRR
jgi:hypothetical protein